MNFRDRIYKPALLMLVVLMFCGVSRVQQLLNQDRTALGFTKVTPLENAPPALAFTSVALGGFRGLIANALWIRANDLQEQDKFFEMVQLSDWITKLEPHFTQVWTHQAWNMAYNISVKFKSPQDRYRWLQRGIRLLRDEGLPLNPDEAGMYREVSWMFQNKMGKDLDDAHGYYKQEWAKEMQALFKGNANIPELVNPTTEEAKERVKILHDRYKMDPKIMEYVDKTYGPFEWRLPDAHAVYWAEAGRRKATPKDQDTLRRSIYQSMQQATWMGKLTERRQGTNYFMVIGPYLDLTPKVNAAYEEMLAQDKKLQDNIGNSHKNFLRVAIYLLANEGRMVEAKHWFKYLKEKYPTAIPTDSLDQYVIEQLTEQVKETDKPKATAVISGVLKNYFRLLATEDVDSADSYMRIALSIYDYYQKALPDMPEARIRIGLDPWPELFGMVRDYMLDPESGELSTYGATVVRTRLQIAAPKPVDNSTNAPVAR